MRTRARSRALGAIVLSVAILGGAEGGQARSRLSRIDRVIARYPVLADTLRVLTTVRVGPPSDESREAVEAVRIVDRFGRAQFVDSLHPLYRAPSGKAAGHAYLTRASSVSLGRAFAAVAFTGDRYPHQHFEADVRRPEVTIDGRHGFVEARDFMAIGLHQVD